jgi:hypothetical protein
MSLDRGRALVDHYRDTFQITWRLWEKRNTSFLLLLGVIGLANLLTHEGVLNGLFLELIGHFKTTGISDRAALTLPYTTVQFIILILVFYFTVNLYQNAASVLRNYAYLSLVEREIRAALGFSPGSVAFTRESDFYWGKRPLFFALVKYFYILILGTILFAYFYVRLRSDLGPFNVLDGAGIAFHAGDGGAQHTPAIANRLLLVADIIIGTPTILVFFAYARQSLHLDRPPPVPKPVGLVDDAG